jgi:hypothetical protein
VEDVVSASFGVAACLILVRERRPELGGDLQAHTGRKWWLLAERRRRTEDEVTEKVERDRACARRKEDFKVEHLGTTHLPETTAYPLVDPHAGIYRIHEADAPTIAL